MSNDTAALLDLDRVGAWLDEHGVAPRFPLTATRVGGGFSNEMFELRRGGEHVVLRRPANIALQGADRGLRREYRFLSALDHTGIPHAAPVALCEDQAVLGCTFYVMQWVDGFMPTVLPAVFDDPAGREAVSFAAVDVLADLGTADWRALGLADLGRPEGFHERQVDRWLGQYRAYPNQELPGIGAAATFLDDHRPREWAPAIMHGDYHMANLLVAPDPPARVAAVCDWETATIGDPLLDLAAFVRFWTEQHPTGDGWPDDRALVERYAARSGRAIPDLSYYSVLARFRLAVMMEGIYQRSLSDTTRDPAIDMHTYSTYLVSGIRELIAAA